MAKHKIPVLLLTGFLGSGKTTLLNRFLTQNEKAPKPLRVAIVVNEFGQLGIDGRLIQRGSVEQGDALIELASGCLCCLLGPDFSATLAALAEQDWDGVIVEASGVALASAIVPLFTTDPRISQKFELCKVVSVVDPMRLGLLMQGSSDDALMLLDQIVHADVAVFSKADLIGAESPEEFLRAREAFIHSTNPIAEVQWGYRDSLFEFRRVRQSISFFSQKTADPSHMLQTWGREFAGVVSKQALQKLFQTLMLAPGNPRPQLLRAKALLHIEGERRPWLIQATGQTTEREEWTGEIFGNNRIAIIGRGFSEETVTRALDRLGEAR